MNDNQQKQYCIFESFTMLFKYRSLHKKATNAFINETLDRSWLNNISNDLSEALHRIDYE